METAGLGAEGLLPRGWVLSLDLRVLSGTGSECGFQTLGPGCSGLGLGLTYVYSQTLCMAGSDVAGPWTGIWGP